MSAPDLSYKMQGTSGKGILLVHGLTGAPDEMKLLAKKLNKRGFSIYAPLLAGHGVDEATLWPTSWRDWLGSLEDAYAEFRPEVEELYVAGICVGGELGLKLAEKHPDIKACAVYSPCFEWDGWNMKKWYRFMSWALIIAWWPMWRNLRFHEPAPYGIKDERMRARAAANMAELFPGALPDLQVRCLWSMYELGKMIRWFGKSIKTPTLIIHSTEDDMASPHNAPKLARALGGPSKIEYIDDSYHMVHVDKQRDKVAELTADYFGAAPARRRTDVAATSAEPEAGVDNG